jgi:hypothetical protein
MKEDDGRVVRRTSGHHSDEPAIQVICLVSDFLAVCAFVRLSECSEVDDLRMSQTIQSD